MSHLNLLARCWIISGAHGGPIVVYSEKHAEHWRRTSDLTVRGPYVLEDEQALGTTTQHAGPHADAESTE